MQCCTIHNWTSARGGRKGDMTHFDYEVRSTRSVSYDIQVGAKPEGERKGKSIEALATPIAFEQCCSQIAKRVHRADQIVQSFLVNRELHCLYLVPCSNTHCRKQSAYTTRYAFKTPQKPESPQCYTEVC